MEMWHLKSCIIIYKVNMANIDERQILSILKKTTGTLEQLSDAFYDLCKDNLGVFNGCSCITDLIEANKIEDNLKFIALFLLLISYKQLPPENNPFIWTILEISKQTQEPLERTMISDILINGNLYKYLNFDMQNYPELVEDNFELVDENKAVDDIREKVFCKFKEIESSSKITHQLTDQEEISQVEFLRPIPEYMPISSSEFHWFSPGIISDIEWDNTADIEKRLDKARRIFYYALERPLDAPQRSQILGLIETDPYCPLQIGFKRQILKPLVNNNPYVASSIIVKIAKTPMICQYFEQLLKVPTTIQIFDCLCRITKQISLPKCYLIFFCEHHMKKIIKSKQEMDEKKSVAATMAAFLQCMLENQIFSLEQVKKTLLEFVNYFDKVIDFAHIKVLLEKNETK